MIMRNKGLKCLFCIVFAGACFSPSAQERSDIQERLKWLNEESL